ncbi:MAG: hypothetical protein C5B60_05835 [Chloroflexi bacterium]|nr:MAG: hypothetical protein C5B60_05835 [Chloroflexota bacterium]
MPAKFPANFPNGPIVDPTTGHMAPGLNGTYFFLALFNRTGGPGGVPLAQRLVVDGIARGMSPIEEQPATPRQPCDGMTIGMLRGSSS